ncbi:MAG TPA: response regulator transcription factor [Gammaproteobacteria bacterium]|nr:response regulator transcription factor [Gammaproteobacteria bacterium]
MIADDHAIVRDAIRQILACIDGVELVGEAEDGIRAIALTKRLKPDLLLLDVAMPHAGGLAVIGEVARWSPKTRVAVLTGIDRSTTWTQLRASGAVGLLLKSCSPQELARGLALLAAGQEYIADRARDSIAAASGGAGLTMRERQILSLAAQGRTNAEIAAFLHISPKTADNHRTNLMRKLDVHSAAELIAFALREGLLDT